MQNNSQNFSMQDIMRIAQSPAGRQLLTLLQGNPAELDRVTKLASVGNINQAKEILQQMISSEDAQKIMRQLGAQNG